MEAAWQLLEGSRAPDEDKSAVSCSPSTSKRPRVEETKEEDKAKSAGAAQSAAVQAQSASATTNPLTAVGLDVWPQAASAFSLRELLPIAAVSRDGLAVVQASIRKVRVMLFSVGMRRSHIWEGSCSDWDRRSMSDEWQPVQMLNAEAFLAQPACSLLCAELGFAEDAQGDLFGNGKEGLAVGLRSALPLCFSADVEVEIEAVRNIGMASERVFETLQAAQPSVMGIEGAGETDLGAWTSLTKTLTKARVLVYAWVEVSDVNCLASILDSLPPLVKGIDFQNLTCSMLGFPVALLPEGCIAFGTIVLQQGVNGAKAPGSVSFGDFLACFPVFPRRVSIVRASLGTDGHWAFPAQVIADVFRAKFPGLAILQIELSMKPTASTTDVPFVELTRILSEAGLRVEVTHIRSKLVQHEFLRAALAHAGAVVHQEEEERQAYPFSHPKYQWPEALETPEEEEAPGPAEEEGASSTQT